MSERDGYPEGVPCWIDTEQPDPRAATRFYGELLGWAFDERAPDAAAARCFVARLRGFVVAAVGPRRRRDQTATWNTYIRVASADSVAERVNTAGGRTLVAPLDVLDAGRMAVCADPSGAVFRLWEPKAHEGAELVNVPGTWNWSDLNTRELQRAAAFYGAVFGWESDPVDVGDGECMLIRLPGYGAFVERLDPSVLRRRTAQGSPAGFSDAIGWMVRIPGDRFLEENPSHWSVTFAVDDIDALADVATQLGGTIVVPPLDAGGVVRATVIADPQGAVFAATS